MAASPSARTSASKRRSRQLAPASVILLVGVLTTASLLLPVAAATSAWGVPQPSAGATALSSVVAKCAVGSGPVQVAYDPLNHDLYVVSASTVSIVASTCHVLKQIVAVNTNFDGVAYDPAAKAMLVSEYNSGEIFVFSGTTLVSEFGGLCSPGPMVWDGTMRAMLVLDYCGEVDAVFALTSSDVTSFGGGCPSGIALADGYVWVADQCGPSVDLYDPATFLSVGSFALPLSPSALAWDPVNDTMLVGSQFSHLMYVLYPTTIATHTFVSTIFPLGTLLGTGGIAYSPSSHDMYITGRIGSYLWTISSIGAVHHLNLGAGASAQGAAYDPANHRVYLCGYGTSTLYVVS